MSTQAQPRVARRVALLSDMHGNADALEAVLADLEHVDYDLVALGGDYVAHGPQPARTLAMCRQLAAPGVVGNTDIHVFEREERGTRWTADLLAEDDLQWLRDLPFSLRFRAVPDDPNSELLLVHATPTSVDAVLISQPSSHPAPASPAATHRSAGPSSSRHQKPLPA